MYQQIGLLVAFTGMVDKYIEEVSSWLKANSIPFEVTAGHIETETATLFFVTRSSYTSFMRGIENKKEFRMFYYRNLGPYYDQLREVFL